MRVACLLALLLAGRAAVSAEAPTETEVRTAMSRAGAFLMDKLSLRGGFVWKYSLDLTERYGELRARDSMVWVEPPGTPTVGLMLLEAYRVTGQQQYLEYADRVAGALTEGQLPCGGWHYFIDFQPSGLGRYCDEFFSRLWAWQEFLHHYDNATFDDDVTTSATRLLLRLQGTPLGPKYREPLLKALGFICRAQYPNGAWPQRYPPRGEFTVHDHRDHGAAQKQLVGGDSVGDSPQPGLLSPSETPPTSESAKLSTDSRYTSYYTFNDGVMANNIDVLLEAHRTLGDKSYRQAARRGMDFYLISQLSEPQAGWAQQYDFDMKPAWGRTFEPPALCSTQTMENISDLMRFYKCTGDRRYLEPTRKALDWLELAGRNTDLGPPYTHTCFYELGTNRPIFMRRTGTTVEDVAFQKVYSPEGAHPYGVRLCIDVDALRKEFVRARALPAAAAHEEYETRIANARPRVKPVSRGSDCRLAAGSPEEIRHLIENLNQGGGWVVENEVLDVEDFQNNPAGVFPGYDTGTYVARMYRLIDYLKLRAREK